MAVHLHMCSLWHCRLCFKKTYTSHPGVALLFSFLPESGALVVIVFGGSLSSFQASFLSRWHSYLVSLPSPPMQTRIWCPGVHRMVTRGFSTDPGLSLQGIGPGSVAVFTGEELCISWSPRAGTAGQPPLAARNASPHSVPGFSPCPWGEGVAPLHWKSISWLLLLTAFELQAFVWSTELLICIFTCLFWLFWR